MNEAHERRAAALIDFIDESPSPFHAVEATAARLRAAGFREVAEEDAFEAGSGRRYLVRGGSLVAWWIPDGVDPRAGFRVVGAHTDSPNLRIKPRPDTGRAGYRQLGVEVYGGALLNSWLNRDLGLSGRVFLRAGSGDPEQRLFRIDRPVCTVPQLAIHLHRDIRTEGLRLNAQEHLAPVWALGDGNEGGFRELLAEELAVEADSILSWDAMCHDTQPSSFVGAEREFLAAPRLDNLCSSYCGLAALLASAERASAKHVAVLTLFDHEEVGSTSSRGATSPLLGDVLERILLAAGGTREDFHRAIARSVCVSSDMAHATHPNYVAKHEPDHWLAMNAGPVLKINANLRYATEAETEALFQRACEVAGVPFQKWVNRTDLACGSTIGPLTAANLGMRTVDVGNPQLSMHSARELCGSLDPEYMVRALTEFHG
ncbi:MAG TPA: M18 family aminopeptidase [Planctomycetes bacterium]|nr:M18 family aminopeptidase [Planctomycetota bacterium]